MTNNLLFLNFFILFIKGALFSLLIILSIEGFGYLLVYSISIGWVHGIALPESSLQLVYRKFVDDTFLMLLEDEINIKESLKCLDTFFPALGSTVQ